MKNLIAGMLLITFLLNANLAIDAQPMSNNQYSIAKLKEAIAKHKYDQSAHMALASMYFDEKEYDKMYNLMKTITKRFKQSPIVLRALNEYALSLYKDGEYDLAEKIAKLALSKYKNDPDTALIYSKILMKTSSINDSISYLESFLKHNPDEVLLHEKLFDLYVYKEDYEGAFNTARRIQDRKIENIMFYFLEALTFLESDRQKAIKYLDAYFEKLQISEDYRPRIMVASKLYKTLKKTSSTADDYIEVIKISEENNAPLSYILLQARYAAGLFPDEPYFTTTINKIYTELGYKK